MVEDGRTEEEVVELLVLDVIKDGRVWGNAEIKDALSSLPRWTQADRQVSTSRSEPRWHNSVNNVLREGFALHKKGFVERHAGRGQHQITQEGLNWLHTTNEWSQRFREFGFDQIEADLKKFDR